MRGSVVTVSVTEVSVSVDIPSSTRVKTAVQVDPSGASTLMAAVPVLVPVSTVNRGSLSWAWAVAPVSRKKTMRSLQQLLKRFMVLKVVRPLKRFNRNYDFCAISSAYTRLVVIIVAKHIT